MHLLLTSAGLTTPTIRSAFTGLFSKPVKEISILMLVLDKEEYADFFLEILFLREVGISPEQIRTVDLADDSINESIDSFDVIYVCGGSTFEILDRMRKTGIFDQLLRSQKESLVYLGVSAGSIIAWPSIDIASWGSTGDVNEIGLEDLTGLGLTETALFPHYNETLAPEVDAFREIVDYPVVTLTDAEAWMVSQFEQWRRI